MVFFLIRAKYTIYPLFPAFFDRKIDPVAPSALHEDRLDASRNSISGF